MNIKSFADIFLRFVWSKNMKCYITSNKQYNPVDYHYLPDKCLLNNLFALYKRRGSVDIKTQIYGSRSMLS